MDDFLLKISVMLVPGMLAITCHEVSHGYIAWHFGDPTARMLGRLTLNPLKHLDPIGTLMIFFIGIGWAKPVPVVFENLRNPKKDMIWVAAAGPITNLVLAALSALLLRGVVALESPDALSPATFIVEPLVLMLAFSVYINLLLSIFNMIPLPPLDGGRVLVGLLPYRQANAWSRLEPYGMLIIIVLVFFTNLFSYVISPLLGAAVHLLAGPQSGLVLGVTSLMMR
ncbi:site-2 protease family protein [Pelobacter propionicus]|uniref:Peptidase M50 n=1 Tax=Pelobacter propionicus (strain DSM 2379 / NBRC 103807 / OttBd1) TaxID=338966 RepID=A1APM9_PELPD|nr:site-2 protease family protein [Pelobacter propionicus]ABK99299.1 peptidase M50 [Pelobacter propionicus DSM 2379]